MQVIAAKHLSITIAAMKVHPKIEGGGLAHLKSCFIV